MLRAVAIAGYSWAILGAAAAQAQAPSYAAEAAPILNKSCVGCHNSAKAKGGINLEAFRSEAAFAADPKAGRMVLDAVESGAMPPDEAPPLAAEVRSKLVAQMQGAASKAGCRLTADPGRVTLRRLNRAEYNNTVRDLLGVDLRPADDFPADDSGYGFDNNGDVLGLPPLLLEKYLAAAEQVADAAIIADDRPRGPSRRFLPEQYGKPGQNGNLEGDSGFWLMHTNAEAFLDNALAKPGEYLVRVRAYGHPAGTEPPKLEVRVDGKAAQTFFVKVESDAPAVFEARVKSRRGGGRLSVAFTNDAYYPDHPNPNRRDRNLSVGDVEVVGPLYRAPDHLPASHTRLIPRHPGPTKHREAARAALAPFATRAYRRPASAAEVDRLVGLVELAEQGGDSFERGVQLAVQAALVSPHFLYRVELERRPGQVRDLTDLELASRLSYFLWSSMPDDELMGLAAKNQLRVGSNLDAQVARMLRDPKAGALVENFAGQWLQSRNLKGASPDRGQFPGFDEPLRTAMEGEVEAFFAHLIREDRPIVELLHADYTFLNERLARHYGIAGVAGDQFRRVKLADPRRGGVVTMASTLLVTSNPTRTSPVKRGKWILEEILGTPPPPPPPGVSDLPDVEKGAAPKTVRERLEQHRSNPDCAACHARLDPLGFGLEGFDAIGALRDRDDSAPIDAQGVLPDGTKFRGPVELKAVLLTRKVAFARCFAEKLMTYALGRGLEESDRCTVERVADGSMAGGGRVGQFVAAIVHADAFGKTNAGSSNTTPGGKP